MTFVRPACGRAYGALPSMCRRLSQHEGPCGPGDEVDHGIASYYEARERVKKLSAKERAGEHWDPEWGNLKFRTTDANRSDLLRRWLRVWEEGAAVAGDLPNETRVALGIPPVKARDAT